MRCMLRAALKPRIGRACAGPGQPGRGLVRPPLRGVGGRAGRRGAVLGAVAVAMRSARMGGRPGPAHLLLLAGVAIKTGLGVDRQVGAARGAALAADTLIAISCTTAPAPAAAP